MAGPNGKIKTTMTPQAFRDARLSLGLSAAQFGVLIGYEKTNSLRAQIHDMESGLKPVRMPQKLLIEAYLSGYRPKNNWPK